MSTSAIALGLEKGDWEHLVELLDRCSEQQLQTVRELVTGAIVNYPTKEEEPMARVEQFEAKSMQLSMELWDLLKNPEDPPASEVPIETLERIAMFAKEVRNRTLEEIATGVERAYTKVTTSVVESIRKQKE